jgi:hypothetical protein
MRSSLALSVGADHLELAYTSCPASSALRESAFSARRTVTTLVAAPSVTPVADPAAELVSRWHLRRSKTLH